eukprot:9266415-Alexandrium_andersonii.AAC.1
MRHWRFSFVKKPSSAPEAGDAAAARRQVARTLLARLPRQHGVPRQQRLGHHRCCGARVDGHLDLGVTFEPRLHGAGALAEGHQFRTRLGLNFHGAAEAAAVGEGREAVAAPTGTAEPGLSRRTRQQTPAPLGAAS